MNKFSEERLLKVIKAPVISEKATFIGEKRNQMMFKVLMDATKPEIKAAIELLFKVNVLSVQTVRRAGKEKKFGKFMGRRNHIKHAFISLTPGQEINFTEGVK